MMVEDAPPEIVGRRMRAHLMAAISCAAEATDLRTLADADWIEYVGDAVEEWGPIAAITGEEYAAVGRLYRRWKELQDEGTRIVRQRNGGKRVRLYREIDVLASLGWFEQIQPLARDAYTVFLKRGLLDEDLRGQA
jgi:hypothetical protein